MWLEPKTIQISPQFISRAWIYNLNLRLINVNLYIVIWHSSEGRVSGSKNRDIMARQFVIKITKLSSSFLTKQSSPCDQSAEAFLSCHNTFFLIFRFFSYPDLDQDKGQDQDPGHVKQEIYLGWKWKLSAPSRNKKLWSTNKVHYNQNKSLWLSQ